MHDGKGIMKSPDGYIYDGTWENGVKQGKATVTYPDGSIYTGEVSQGSAKVLVGSKCLKDWPMKGHGKQARLMEKVNYPKNGDVYVGTLVNGRREGLGKVTYANGDIYEGNFADDQRSGQGKFIGADGYKYEEVGKKAR